MALPGDPKLTGKAKYRKVVGGKAKPKTEDKSRKDYSMDELMGEGWRDRGVSNKPVDPTPKKKK